MITVLKLVVYIFLIILSCCFVDVTSNSNNTIETNIRKLRIPRVAQSQNEDEIGHETKYYDLDIHHDKNARSLMLKIKALYEIGERNPDELINILTNDDPFGVSRLTNPHEFVCNKSERFPYHVDREKFKKFKDHEEGYYIFFQHIRKAGGTTMCALAKENLLPHESSGAYCLMDPWIGSLGSYPFSKIDFFEGQMKDRGLRYAPNEATPFDDAFFNYHGAIFITMFREPMDRWYSQYRFDYLEGRYMSSSERRNFDAGHKLTFVEWYRAHKSEFVCPNVYTNAFIGQTLIDQYVLSKIMNREHFVKPGSKFFWAYQQRAKIPLNHRNFIRALDNLSKFSMIFILEWLNEAPSQDMFKESLGWTKTAEHVLPQQNVVKREEDLSQKSITDVSHNDYMEIARENVYDLLLYQITKRMFLERLQCNKT